jgi:hypothetical protein
MPDAIIVVRISCADADAANPTAKVSQPLIPSTLPFPTFLGETSRGPEWDESQPPGAAMVRNRTLRRHKCRPNAVLTTTMRRLLCLLPALAALLSAQPSPPSQ